MLKTVVLFNSFVKTMIHFFSGFFNEDKVLKNSIYETEIFCNLTMSLIKLNVSLAESN